MILPSDALSAERPDRPLGPCCAIRDRLGRRALGSSRRVLLGARLTLALPVPPSEHQDPLAAGTRPFRRARRTIPPSSWYCSRSASRCAARSRRLWARAVRLRHHDARRAGRRAASWRSVGRAPACRRAEPRPRTTPRAPRRLRRPSVPYARRSFAIGIGTSRRSRSGGAHAPLDPDRGARAVRGRSRISSWAYGSPRGPEPHGPSGTSQLLRRSAAGVVASSRLASCRSCRYPRVSPPGGQAQT